MKITTNAPRLAATFRQYAIARGKDLNELMLDQGRKLATQLYVETAAVAPTKAQIAADVKKQGWKIPAFFKDGRLGRGFPAMWAREKKRGRPRKNEGWVSRRQVTLAQMQAFVTRWRVAHRLFVASGWLGAVEDLGGTLSANSGAIDRKRGRAEIQQETNYTRITIVNDTPGILYVDGKHDIAKKAIAARIADMMVYIARKSRERAEQIFGRAA